MTSPRRLTEWKLELASEHRFLTRERRLVETRLAEIEQIQREFGFIPGRD
jgi:hypothetical protein